MIHGLKNCCLATALTLNPVIFQSHIREFWNTAAVNQGEDGSKSIEANVKGCKVVVIEQIIWEMLRIEDQPGLLTEIAMDSAQEIIDHLGYEGEFPPTIKKLLPPY